MITFTAGQQAALEAGAVVRRWFFRFDVLGAAGAAAPVYLWSGLGTRTVTAIAYKPIKCRPKVSKLKQVSDLSVQNASILTPAVPGMPIWDMITGVDGTTAWHQKPATIGVGLFNTSTREIIDTVIDRFYGFIDKAPVVDGKKGAPTTVQLSLESIAREMTRRNYSTRSKYDQMDVATNDPSYEHTNKEMTREWGALVKPNAIRNQQQRARRGRRDK